MLFKFTEIDKLWTMEESFISVFEFGSMKSYSPFHKALERDEQKCEAVLRSHPALNDENRSRFKFWIVSIQNHRDLAEQAVTE